MYSNAEGMLPVSRLGTVLRAAGQSPTNATVEAIVAQLPDQVISEIQFQDILQQNYKVQCGFDWMAVLPLCPTPPPDRQCRGETLRCCVSSLHLPAYVCECMCLLL